MFRMYIGISDVTENYYFWSGVLVHVGWCLRTRLTYKSDCALACIYLHRYIVVLHEQYLVPEKGSAGGGSIQGNISHAWFLNYGLSGN